jgi:hypothetical protein
MQKGRKMNRRGFFKGLVGMLGSAAAVIALPSNSEAEPPEGCRYCHNWTPRPDLMTEETVKDKFGFPLEIGFCRLTHTLKDSKSVFDGCTWSDDLCFEESPPRMRHQKGRKTT